MPPHVHLEPRHKMLRHLDGGALKGCQLPAKTLRSGDDSENRLFNIALRKDITKRGNWKLILAYVHLAENLKKTSSIGLPSLTHTHSFKSMMAIAQNSI